MKPKRKRLKGKEQRHLARCTRDSQWRFLERIAEHGTLWFCPWNKKGLPQGPDEWRDCLIGGMDILNWFGDSAPHSDWVIFGEWDDDHYAMPVQLTEAGRSALANREKYDMEPVIGGLVEPGYIVTPAPPVLEKGT